MATGIGPAAMRAPNAAELPAHTFYERPVVAQIAPDEKHFCGSAGGVPLRASRRHS
jgi:hypothetical protein